VARLSSTVAVSATPTPLAMAQEHEEAADIAEKLGSALGPAAAKEARAKEARKKRAQAIVRREMLRNSGET
jgi:hypothetical protein